MPTKHYAAKSAWQQLGILANNLIRRFQLDTLAESKPRSRKRIYSYWHEIWHERTPSP